VDAQNGGQADGIDPADQWVLNPQTGNYELRLDNSGGQLPPSPPRGTTPGTGRPGGTGSRRDVPDGAGTRSRPGPAGEGPAQRGDAPGPRSRRAGNGPAGESPAVAGRRKRKQKKSKKKALLWTGGVMAFLLVAVSASGYLYYRHLNSNIKTVDIVGGDDKGFQKDQAINILVIGTDKRTGAGNSGYGDKNSVGHADTTLLLHVAKDRTNATALSIPRDLITNIPDCQTIQPDGTKKNIPGTDDTRFNTSLGQDGRDPGCTMKTVGELTGIVPDHFMMVDFNAVKTLTTAVGGVDVCVGKDVNDPDSHLKLTKGEHLIEGEQALAFVRTRHSFGNQGDLDRIKVQQQFLGAMMRKITSKGTLTSPAKVFKLAEAATKSLTVDSGIGSITKLQSLAGEMKSVNPKNISFTTLPVMDNPNQDHATVVPIEAQAQQLFSLIKSDTSLTEVKKQQKAAVGKQDAVLKGPKAAPADVRVSVYNGGGPQGSAQETLTWLQNDEKVLKSSNEGNAPANVAKTTLEYAPNQADQARALAAMMGLRGAALKQGTEDAVGLQAMKLTLGADFKGAGVPITGPAKAPDNVQKVEADKQVCSK
jgi:LCP family protein required for cell wall assembly